MASNEIEILEPAVSVEKLKKIAAGRALNRRNFIAALGMTGAAAGAGLMSGCSSTTSSVAVTSSSPAQTDVLNFALNLEYLEATFYSFITQGTDLTGTAVLNSGAITGAPAKLTFPTQQITDMLNEIYYDEKSHVTTLIGLLGSAAVPRPAINLAALGAITANNALSIARLFEDVGVTAYNGAAQALSSSDLTYASQILAVEGFHAGAIRLTAIQNPSIAANLTADTLDVPAIDPGSAAAAAAGPSASGGFFATAGSATSSAANPAGFAFSRTTSQVLAIVYGAGTPASAGTSSGGFFPNGVNGRIKTV